MENLSQKFLTEVKAEHLAFTQNRKPSNTLAGRISPAKMDIIITKLHGKGK